MKKLSVKKVSAKDVAAKDVVELLDSCGVEFNVIDTLNWPNEYSYLPHVKFRIAHTGDELLLQYRVNEQAVRAIYGQDNGDVWKDSCVEFFVQFDGEPNYYNIETNCIGTALVGFGEGRQNRLRAGNEITSTLKRWSSLGREPFDDHFGTCSWELSLVIPRTIFFKSALQTFDAVELNANFYKCGDELEVPHFVSWNAIEVAQPDFHRPEFFGRLICENN